MKIPKGHVPVQLIVRDWQSRVTPLVLMTMQSAEFALRFAVSLMVSPPEAEEILPVQFEHELQV
jgi:hypothetical protein